MTTILVLTPLTPSWLLADVHVCGHVLGDRYIWMRDVLETAMQVDIASTLPPLILYIG
jgi:hypothetical protein